MKNWKIVAVVACAFALCLALVGCGGGSSNEPDPKEAFIGTWDLSSMIDSEGTETAEEDIQMLAELGLDVYLNMNEDGTAQFVMFGEPMEGTWDATAANTGSMTLEGQEINLSIADGILTLEQDGTQMMFKPGEARE